MYLRTFDPQHLLNALLKISTDSFLDPYSNWNLMYSNHTSVQY